MEDERFEINEEMMQTLVASRWEDVLKHIKFGDEPSEALAQIIFDVGYRAAWEDMARLSQDVNDLENLKITQNGISESGASNRIR